MTWFHEVAERDHELQNPTSRDKIVLLGDHLRLSRASSVLDIACGKGGPALILASTYGCSVHGVEKHESFADEARARISDAGLDSLVTVRTADAAEVPLEPEAWDAALCLGAAFVWGTIADAAAALAPAVRRSGFVAIGEPFWRQWPLDPDVDPSDFVSLEATVERFERAGLATTGMIAASEDDWDRYESLHWRALEEWLAAHPGHPDAKEIGSRHEDARRDYLRFRRTQLGWAICVGRKA